MEAETNFDKVIAVEVAPSPRNVSINHAMTEQLAAETERTDVEEPEVVQTPNAGGSDGGDTSLFQFWTTTMLNQVWMNLCELTEGDQIRLQI